MALVKCTECGNEIAAAAATCPRCGQPNAAAPPPKRSHSGGWLALGALVLGAFTPAILVPLLVLAALAFSAKEISRGSKVFGGLTLCLALWQGWILMEHFGQVSAKVGLTTPADATAKAAAKYANVSLDVPHDWKTILESKCRREWPADFKMQQHCTRGQTEAVRTLTEGAQPGVDQTAFRIIRGKCAEDWPDDFKMRAHCERSQTDGYRSLATSVADKPGAASCAQKWPDDFRMRQHCESRL